MRITKAITLRLKKSRVLNFFARNAAYLLLRFLFMTYRLDVLHAEQQAKILPWCDGVCYFWHQHIIAGMFFFFRSNLRGACVVSPSSDGRFAGFLCRKLGFKVFYGSSHKASVSVVRRGLRELHGTGRLCLVGDGSRGPALKLQPGVRYLAKKSGKPLVFIECKAKSAITCTKSWDQFKIPLPFSKISVIVHEPVYVGHSHVCPGDAHQRL
ncbi:MAG: DUF374 domain-containing protein [Candidatus Babeliales bacterium]|jgi:hypothetical protein